MSEFPKYQNQQQNKINERESLIKPEEKLSYTQEYLKESNWNDIDQKLSHDTIITTLEFSGINIDADGLKHLSNIILNHPQIENLKLEWNYLFEYEREFEDFCNAVANSNIVFLSLGNNKINSNLATYIANIIKKSKTIKFIDLKWNELGTEGAKIILSVISLNQNNINISFIGNKVRMEELQMMNEGLIKRREFDKYRYDNNPNFRVKKKQTAQNIMSLHVLEKEKSLSAEYKSKYEQQLLENQKLQKAFKEIENRLDFEKKRMDKMKVYFDESIKVEKENRKKSEMFIQGLKDDLSKVSIERNRLEKELQEKVEELEREKSNLNIKLREINETLERRESQSKEDISFLKNENEQLKLDYNAKVAKLVKDFEAKKKEFVDENKKINEQFRIKEKEFTTKIEQLKSDKEELEKKLNEGQKEHLNESTSLEQMYKKRQAQTVENQKKRFEIDRNDLEKEIHLLKSQKNEIEKKYNELVSNKKDKNEEAKKENDREYNELIVSKAQIDNKNAQLTSENKKLLEQMRIKDNEKEQLMQKVKELENYKKAVDKNMLAKLNEREKNFNREKEVMEMKSNKQNEKIEELEKNIEQLKNRLNKIEINIPRINEKIKTSVFSYIDSTK